MEVYISIKTVTRNKPTWTMTNFPTKKTARLVIGVKCLADGVNDEEEAKYEKATSSSSVPVQSNK
jgi:hypothetical protein